MKSMIERVIHGPWLPPAVGKAPYLWINSLVFLLIQYAAREASVLEVVLLVASVVLFIPLFFMSFWPGRGRYLALSVTCLLGVLWAPYNVGANTFFVFASGMCAGIMPARRAYLTLAGVMGLGLVVLFTVNTIPIGYRWPALAMSFPVGVAAIMDATLRRSREQLLRKQEEVEHMATIAERERISRDLHDLLGHTLSLITLKAELAGKLMGRNEAACRQEIADIERSARTALAEVRAAVTGYRQSGLAHELATARASLAAAGVDMASEVQPVTLPAAAENVMALALREAVTNIVRHSGASACSVRLAQHGETIHLYISDNGAATGEIHAGNGLTGMRERVSGMGGRLLVRREQGLSLELILPIGAV